MDIQAGPPPNAGRRQIHNRYVDFIEAVRQLDGGWASISAEYITGNATQKCCVLHNCARKRGVRIQTSMQQGRMYARLVKSSA